MYNRSEIMKAAGAIYREAYTFGGACRFDRRGFAWALRKAWSNAREACRIAAIPADRKVARIAQIDREVDVLQYSSLRYDIGAIRRGLQAERTAFAA